MLRSFSSVCQLVEIRKSKGFSASPAGNDLPATNEALGY